MNLLQKLANFASSEVQDALKGSVTDVVSYLMEKKKDNAARVRQSIAGSVGSGLGTAAGILGSAKLLDKFYTGRIRPTEGKRFMLNVLATIPVAVLGHLGAVSGRALFSPPKPRISDKIKIIVQGAPRSGG